MANFFITVGKNTAGHKDRLVALGYEVEDGLSPTGKARYVIKNAEVFEGNLDLSEDAKASILGLVSGKQMLTYTTPIIRKDGRTVYGIAGGVAALEAVHKGVSCFMANPMKVKAKDKPAEMSVEDFLGI